MSVEGRCSLTYLLTCLLTYLLTYVRTYLLTYCYCFRTALTRVNGQRVGEEVVDLVDRPVEEGHFVVMPGGSKAAQPAILEAVRGTRLLAWKLLLA